MGSSVGAHIQLCTCSPCLASMLLRQLSAFRLAIVHLISSPNVVWESSSTRSLMQSQAKSPCCLSEACDRFFLRPLCEVFSPARAGMFFVCEVERRGPVA